MLNHVNMNFQMLIGQNLMEML